jgi:hypothetical protein
MLRSAGLLKLMLAVAFETALCANSWGGQA